MSGLGLKIGATTLCLLLSCRWGLAVEGGTVSSAPTGPVVLPPSASAPPAPIPAQSAAPGASPTALAPPANSLSASPQVVPVSPGPAQIITPPVDAGTNKRFYTFSVSLRETYDDNANTSNTNKQSSLETDVSPSVLIQFHERDNDLTGSYTLGAAYYDRAPTGGGGGLGGGATSQLNFNHSLLLSETHRFSDRFSLNVAEQFGYSMQPNIYQSIGTSFQNGDYFSNTLDGTFSAQWTPLFGTTTTYANTVVEYQDSQVGNSQNSIENTFSETGGWAVYPKITANLGGTYDNIGYTDSLRGYDDYTLFVGGSWVALPSLTLSARGGGSYVVPAVGSATTSPYADISIGWQVGARSSASFDYSHEITPSDQVGAQGQISDRITASALYDITSRLTTSMLAAYTSSSVSGGLTNNQAAVSSSEQVYDLEPELIFHYNSYLDLNGGIGFSGNLSQIADRNYTRTTVYVGLRGTY